MDKYCVGLDVDKKRFKACFSLQELGKIKVKSTRCFLNQLTGFKDLLVWMDKHQKNKSLPISVVLEVTGVYHEAITYFLAARQIQLHVVLPTRAKHYMRSLGHRSKTDKLDAKGLSYMACQQELEVWQMPDQGLLELRSLTRQIEALQEQKTILKNQFEAFNHTHTVHKESLKSNQRILAVLEKEIVRLRQEVKKLIENNELLHAKYQYFSTLKGIGLMCFAVIVSETNGFTLFRNQKQLTCYTGYDVIENQSGQRAGKTRISKKGNTHIRRILHMAAWSAVSHKVSPFYQLYQRVYERTGIKMKAYVAVQRKLLMMVYTLWRKDQDFDPTYGMGKEGFADIQGANISVVLQDNISPQEKNTATSIEVAALDSL